MGMARNAMHHQEGSSSNWNEPWLIPTRVPHLSCSSQGLLQSLGGCSLPSWSQVTQTRGQSTLCCPSPNKPGHVCWAPRSRQRQRREQGKAFEMPQLPAFYPQSQKKPQLTMKKKGFHQD